MKICQKCQTKFNPRAVINGKTRFLYRRKFCTNCSPFGQHNTTNLLRPSPIAMIDKLSSAEFANLIKTSISRTEIFHKLKLRKSGASFRILNRRLEQEKLDTSHFRKGSMAGETQIYSDEEAYCKESKHRHIRIRAFNDKIMEYKCKECGIDGAWNNKPITLEIDHINGDRYDNRKENLRWLCPNCHSQTSTYCTKRRT